ncbi:MAG: sigma-70 family RNA polymerase sigma factor [Clostridia bacterium]|nr:sigma-70 family RNA polymerase sigma factor [Clostridia bacterium]
MNDDKIVELYLLRNEKAIKATAYKYGKYCYSIAYGILENREDAEECVNEAYLNTWNCIPPQRPKLLRTFIGKITRNLSLKLYEKRSAEKRGGGQAALCLEELAECIPANSDGGRIADDIAIKQLLNGFLEGLPTDMRRVFVRRYWYMSSVAEIADMYGFTHSKVATLLHRGRKKLKALLEKEGIEI